MRFAVTEELDYKKVMDNLLYCAKQHSGCGLCPMSETGCYATKLKTDAAKTIDELMKSVHDWQSI